MLMMQSRFQLKKKQTQRWKIFQRLSTNQNKHPNLENVVSMVSKRRIAENVRALRSARTENESNIAENVGAPRFARMGS